MVSWAVLSFGLIMLLVALAIPRAAFAITLIVLLGKSGWLGYFGGNLFSEFLATFLTAAFAIIAVAGGLALDWHDHCNR